jgi:transcriptional repressor NrdR
MICLKCNNPKTNVINSRQAKKQPETWRRRQCLKCKYIFTTYELPAYDQIVVHTNGKDVPFHITTLSLSIASCFEHTPKDRANFTQSLTNTIIAKLIRLEKEPLSPNLIAHVTFDTLKTFDRLASIQYAARHADILSSKIK